MPFLANFLPGYGAVSVESLTSSGPITGTVVKGTTALEFPTSGAGPGVRATDDPDSGFGVVGANQASMWAGGFIWWSALVGSVQTSSAASILNTGVLTTTPRTVDVDAAGDTIPVTGAALVIVTLSAGNITSSATPFLADGANGQEIILIGGQSGAALTLSDEGTVPGSNLHLGAATRALGFRDVLSLRFSTVAGGWVETAFVNVT